MMVRTWRVVTVPSRVGCETRDEEYWVDRLQEEGELSAQGTQWGVQPRGRRSSWLG